VELKAYVHASINQYRCTGDDKYRFALFGHDMTDSGYVLVKELTVDVEVPDEKDLDLKTVEVLKAKLKQVRVDHYQEEQRIQFQIDKLLALEHKVDPLAWSKAAGVEEF
jgi:hypothetical protein